MDPMGYINDWMRTLSDLYPLPFPDTFVTITTFTVIGKKKRK